MASFASKNIPTAPYETSYCTVNQLFRKLIYFHFHLNYIYVYAHCHCGYCKM